MFIDLNTIGKKEFVEALICSDDVDGFYYPNEKELLSLEFDFEEMKQRFEKWLEENCD